jgi:hypothetical protein
VDINNYDQIAQLAQKISFAYEDSYDDEKKQKMFHALFNRYLAPVDPGGTKEPYDAILSLWRSNISQLEQMIKEMKDNDLISD